MTVDKIQRGFQALLLLVVRMIFNVLCRVIYPLFMRMTRRTVLKFAETIFMGDADMNALYNMVLYRSGYVPADVPAEKIAGGNWFTWVRPQRWTAPDGRELSTLEAVAEVYTKAGVTL